jgi:hypothetical protein
MGPEGWNVVTAPEYTLSYTALSTLPVIFFAQTAAAVSS